MTPPVHTLILPAAGFGTRMRSVHPTLSKELLPLGARRVIEYALLEAEDAQLTDIVVILRDGKEELKDFLDNCKTTCRLHFTLQQEMNGEGGAILQAREVLRSLGRDDPFAVLYPDNVGHPAPGMLREVCAAFDRTGKDTVALMRVTPESAPGIGNAGRVRLDPPRHEFSRSEPPLHPILDFLPKGTGSFPLHGREALRTCGLFVTLPHFFNFIDMARQQGFSGELTDGKIRRIMLEHGVEFLGVPLSRMVYDTGNPTGYAKLAALLDPEQANAR
ncbi:MAG: sugar phosphate nucleotidyltransferase [Desulfovibrio sp.]